ncbi:hypothetical protein VP01_731g3 [Puccinia sorghi]|uniref:Uncharacterized protein n=1 Tax=Puccinia sorghi TaxID=27349 RepID=A0A0L6UCW5_9BASI|nr:hypothetical protein VP01_731g3 [Puccinia sorghi]
MSSFQMIDLTLDLQSIGQELEAGQAELEHVPRSAASPTPLIKPPGHKSKPGWHCAKRDLDLCPTTLDAPYIQLKIWEGVRKRNPWESRDTKSNTYRKKGPSRQTINFQKQKLIGNRRRDKNNGMSGDAEKVAVSKSIEEIRVSSRYFIQ